MQKTCKNKNFAHFTFANALYNLNFNAWTDSDNRAMALGPSAKTRAQKNIGPKMVYQYVDINVQLL